MLWLWLVACRVVDAPENIEELMTFGFVQHGAADSSWPTAFATNLLPELDSHAEELEKGYRVGSLLPEDIAEAGFESTAEGEVAGVAATSALASSPAEVVAVLSLPDITPVFSSSESYELKEHSDRDCFLAGECEFYTYSFRRSIDLGILGSVTQDALGSFRRLTLEDGTEVVLWQTAAPDPGEVTGGLMTVQQQYSEDLFFPAEGGGTGRATAMWLDAQLVDSDLPDSFLISTSVSSLGKANGELDAFVEAGGLD
ncbi:MAG TPA: hypothetical protein PLA94_31205 [Myxococcota bacterium]|nr:hypothetical protein [Myxococcota bacterium]